MPGSPNLARILDFVAARYPTSAAVIDDDGEVSWTQLRSLVLTLQSHFGESGIRKDDCVVLLCKNSREFVIAFWATIRLGAIVSPINYRSKAAELAHVIAKTKAKMIVHDDEFQGVVREACAEIREKPNSLSRGQLQEILSSPATPSLNDEPNAQPCEDRNYDDPAWYFFTSGTTGKPKAAVLTHGQLHYVINNHLAELIPDAQVGDMSLAVAPLSHGAGCHMLVNAAKGVGTVIIQSGSFSAETVVRIIEKREIANLFAVPTIVKLLAEELLQNPRELPKLKQLIYAGAPMYREDQKRALKAFGFRLTQYYGLAEVTGNITVLPDYEHSLDDYEMRISSCGFPRIGMDIRVVDVQTGDPVDAMQSGEVCVKGPAVFLGYLDDEAATRTVLKDGWFYTGDIGHLDQSGYLYLTSRKSDMFISGGTNVYPREVEEVALIHDDVNEAVVVGIPHKIWGEAGAMVIVAKSDAISTSDLEVFLRSQLSSYKVPKIIKVWDSIPKTAYGKVSKNDLRETLLGDPAVNSEFTDPS